MNKMKNKAHWSHVKEQGGILGLSLSWWCYRLLGKKMCYFLAYPVAMCYYIFCSSARTASKNYLQRIAEISHTKALPGFKHFVCFAQTIIDKMMAWCHDIPLHKIHITNENLLKEILGAKRGGIIFSAHIGNTDVARSLCHFTPEVKVNTFMSKAHARKFKSFLQRINPNSIDDILYLEEINLESACLISDKVERGEFIAIAADRTSPTLPQKNIAVNFLERTVFLPQGPFILAKILNCPSYFMYCVKKQDSFILYFEEMKSCNNIKESAQNYAHIIEDLCLRYPLQWFNFFNFLDSKVSENDE